jgi:RND family efflux transporter MFP subunit
MSPVPHTSIRRRRPQGAPAVYLAIVVAIVASLGLLSGCGGDASSEDAAADSTAAPAGGDEAAAAETSDEGDEEESDRPSRERATTVNVAEVIRGDLVLPVVAEGTIRAPRSTEIRTEIKGRVEKLLIAEGTRVSAGDVLARLDAREHRVAYDEARSAYLEKLSRLAVEERRLDPPPGAAAVESTLEDQIAALEREEARGSISRAERLEREVALQLDALEQGAYRSDVIAARSGIASAHAAMERAALDLERTRIRAPFDGVVSDITVSEGEQVTANQRVAKLVDDVRVEAEVGVLESDLGGLAVGRPVLLEVPALGDTLLVTLDVLSPEVDPATRTCRVLMRLDGSGRVRPGMFVRAYIAGDVVEDCLIVPHEAVLTRDGRPLVFKVDDERAKWTYVELGRGNDYLVEIRNVLRGGSLTPGDQVIVSGHLTLAHDAKVRVRRTITPHDPWSLEAEK